MAKKATRSRTENAPKKGSVELTKVERFYIEKNTSSSVESVAKDLGRPVDQIKEYYQKALTERKNNDKITAFKLMNHNPEKGYAVMTQEAASLEKPETQSKPSTTNHIHKIR